MFDRVDGFILDAFGVLNRGDTVIPGAVERIGQMRAAGKKVVVLTNGALLTPTETRAKFARWGFDFAPHEIVSSRALVADAVATLDGPLAAIGPAGMSLGDLPATLRPLTPALLNDARGFVFLDAKGWTSQAQEALVEALRRNPRPVICANPDIVAPRDHGMTWEPGHYAHDLPVPVTFLGKPFSAAHDAALAALALPPARVAMVGDTLHTDVLGGAAAGCLTVLVKDHGFLTGHDPAPFIEASGIRPDVILSTT